MDRAPRAPAPRDAAAELIDAAWSLRTPAETAHPKSGLSADAAGERRAAHGANAIAGGRRGSAFVILAQQFRDLMVVVLIAAAGVASLVGEPQDTIAILAIVALMEKVVRRRRPVAAGGPGGQNGI